jgi:hypothetical protein
VSAAVNCVGRETQPVGGAVEHVSSAYDTTSYSDAVKDGYDCVVDLNGANVSSQVEKTTSRSYSKNNCLEKSTHESRICERELDINAGNNGDAGLKNVSTDRQAIQKDGRFCWRPVYEDISEPDSDVDATKDTKLLETGRDGLVFTQYVNLDCDRPRNSPNRRRHRDPADVTKHKAEAIKKRRHSAPEDPGDSARKRKKKEEKQKKRHRRWSFNTESDVYQTDHGETKKKLYLNRLLLSKDATRKSWNVCIDIARDEHTTEEFQFPELPLPKNMVKKEKEGKEEKEAAAVTEEKSSGVVDSARESSPVNGQTKSGNCSDSEIKQEMNIEDEDTIDGPRVFVTVPKGEVNQMYNSSNVTEDSSVCGPEDTILIPRSAENKLMSSCRSGIRNETEEQYESQINEACVDGKSGLHALKGMEPVEHSSSDTFLVTRGEKDKRVEYVPYNLAKIMKTHGCSTYAHHQNTCIASKQIKESRVLSANIENDGCANVDSGMRRHRSSPECPSGKNPDDIPRNDRNSNRTTDSLLPNIEEVGSACSTCAQNERSVPLNDFDCNCSSEERGCPMHKEECHKRQTSRETFSRNLESHPPTASIKISSEEDVTAEERISKRSFANTSNSMSHKEPVNDREIKQNENYGNDPDKEHSICKNNVHRAVDQTDKTHGVGTQIESERAGEDVNEGGESRELMNGNRCSSLPKMAKRRRKKPRFISTEKPQHESNKESSGNNSRTRKKPRGPRKPRYSRRSFRHDNIQMFKVSTAFPPHNTPVPWRYKCKKPELPDPFDTNSVNLPSPVLNPSVTESRSDGCVTNIEIEDDIPSPASLTIDLGEQNTNASETSNLEEDERTRRKTNSDASGAEGDAVTPLNLRRRVSGEAGLSVMDEKPSLAASPEHQSGDMDSESSDEGQSKKRRKRAKKKKSGMIFQSFCLPTSGMNTTVAVSMYIRMCSHCTGNLLGTEVSLYYASYISASFRIDGTLK